MDTKSTNILLDAQLAHHNSGIWQNNSKIPYINRCHILLVKKIKENKNRSISMDQKWEEIMLMRGDKEIITSEERRKRNPIRLIIYY